jgi:hypothetical protein
MKAIHCCSTFTQGFTMYSSACGDPPFLSHPTGLSTIQWHRSTVLAQSADHAQESVLMAHMMTHQYFHCETQGMHLGFRTCTTHTEAPTCSHRRRPRPATVESNITRQWPAITSRKLHMHRRICRQRYCQTEVVCVISIAAAKGQQG